MASCCIHCGAEEGELHASDCPELRQAFDRLTHERDEALAEVERLRKCCTQRGARMQIMRDWMDDIDRDGPPTDWQFFTDDYPEARDWFDDDGVPK